MTRAFNWGLLLLTASLVACGGGGGGGGSSAGGSSGGTPPGGGGSSASPAALSTTNATTAAAAVVDSVFLVAGSSEPLAAVPIGVVVSGGGSFKLNDFLSTQLRTLNNIKASIAPTPVGVETTTAINCTLGGTISFTLNDIDNSGDASTGDTFTLTFNGCNEDGAVLNGRMSVSNMVLTQTSPTAYSFSGAITISNLNYVDINDSGSLNGTMTFAESSSDSITVTSTLNVSSLVATGSGETLTISNLATTVIQNTSTGAYSMSISDGTINSAQLGGTVTIRTLTPLQAIGTAYPHAGSLKITGANSSITLTISNANVRITVDSNNDGIPDSFIDKTWSELDSGI